MKKIYLILITTLFVSFASFAQTVILAEDFTLFNATSDSTFHGWYLSYYGTGSFYTSATAPAGSAGPSGPNTYKFGKDFETAITPMFMGGDSVHFFLKGNPAAPLDLGQSTFYVYESPDSMNWTSLHTFNPPMDTTKAGYMNHFQLDPTSMWLKFVYDKDIGNVAFDDFSVTSNNVGISNPTLEQRTKIFPSPTTGKLSVSFGNVMNGASFSVINILGKQVFLSDLMEKDDTYVLNLSSLQDGIYFLKIRADRQTLTKRIIVKH